MIPADTFSLSIFYAIIILILSQFTYVLIKTNQKKTVLGMFIWLTALSLLVSSGLVATHSIALLPILFVSVNLVSLGFAFSSIAGKLALGISIQHLVLFQTFRFPLELVLHSWATHGTIPYTMTWEGQNWDIISGILAFLAFPFAQKYRWTAWTANIVGLVLLLNVMRVAVLSSPLPFAWQVEPPLLLAFHLPYALILPVCVGGALIGHIILTRALLRD